MIYYTESERNNGFIDIQLFGEISDSPLTYPLSPNYNQLHEKSANFETRKYRRV